MPRGRPTSDPKATLLAVRLGERHVRLLREHARREEVSLSEALRRLLDERLAARPPRGRPPTPSERRMFDRVFAAFDLAPASPRRRSRR
jgi:hypothetical protein